MGADNNDISATQTKVTRDSGPLPRGVFARGEGEFSLPLFQKGVRLKKREKKHICDISKSKTDEKMVEKKQ